MYITNYGNYSILVCYFQLKHEKLPRNSCIYSLALICYKPCYADISDYAKLMSDAANYYKEVVKRKNYDVK